jgi:predicted enzyme related to lactoylglutathione lyase
MANVISWFEIPAKDFQRACNFYGAVLSATLSEIVEFPGEGRMAYLPGTTDSSGGAVIEWKGCEPSAQGTIVYLYAGDDLAVLLGRVEKAGGKIVMPKTQVGDQSFVAQFLDSEGNKVGLYSQH